MGAILIQTTTQQRKQKKKNLLSLFRKEMEKARETAQI